MLQAFSLFGGTDHPRRWRSPRWLLYGAHGSPHIHTNKRLVMCMLHCASNTSSCFCQIRPCSHSRLCQTCAWPHCSLSIRSLSASSGQWTSGAQTPPGSARSAASAQDKRCTELRLCNKQRPTQAVMLKWTIIHFRGHQEEPKSCYYY